MTIKKRLTELSDLIDSLDDNEVKDILVELDNLKSDVLHTHKEFEPIVGPKGEKGDPGKDGRNGKDGKNGRDGKDGKDGRDGIDGENGLNGKDGIDGKNGQSFNWRGRWVKDTVYIPYDVVEFYGSSYVALKENSTVPILSDEDWDLMASAGMAGGQGAMGPQGVQGADGNVSNLIAKMVFGKTPTPTPNGVIVIFYTSAPYVAGTLRVWRGSLRMYPTLDVVETDPATGSFTLVVAPNSNEPLLVEYIKS
jgi:hypothetical protein